jgi:hypothetical protein
MRDPSYTLFSYRPLMEGFAFHRYVGLLSQKRKYTHVRPLSISKWMTRLACKTIEAISGFASRCFCICLPEGLNDECRQQLRDPEDLLRDIPSVMRTCVAVQHNAHCLSVEPVRMSLTPAKSGQEYLPKATSDHCL